MVFRTCISVLHNSNAITGMDGLDTGRRHEESGETRRMEGAGCKVICGAPTVQRDYGIDYY